MTTTPKPRTLKRALIVEDDAGLAAAIVRMLEGRNIPARPCATLAEGMSAIDDGPWDLVIVDVRLPDGSGLDLCRVLCARAPRPVIVALSGAAVAKEGYELAQLGVGAFLEKPFDEADLWRAVEGNAGVGLETVAVAAVGTVPLTAAQAQVRRAMIREALARGRTVTETARILGVTRQAVQQALDGMDSANEPEAG